MSSWNTVEEELLGSGLTPQDIHARPLESAEKAACDIPNAVGGYVIPYYGISGRPQPFYRCKLFDYAPKYKQPKDSPPYVYFPPTFMALAKGSPYILICEGEKKAALACKLGFPTVGLGGIDAWRNRILSLPHDTELSKSSTKSKAKLPSGGEPLEQAGSLAIGVQELIDWVVQFNKTVIFVYDSDIDTGIKPQVQRACADFAFDLRFRGIPFSRIRQIVLPPTHVDGPRHPEGKIGFDDYLLRAGTTRFQHLLEVCLSKKSAFPRHPSIRDYINKQLQRANMSRKEMQRLSIAILSDLDANGIRLKNTSEGQAYYFDYVTRKLIRTTLEAKAEDAANTPFGQFLYRRYGLGGADKRLIIWLAAHFTGEDPIEEVSPFRVIARTNASDDCVNYQISDSQFIRVSADGLEVRDNGDDGILFESTGIEDTAVNVEKLLRHYAELEGSSSPLSNQWADVLSSTRLKDHGRQSKVTALLYYVSPWLYRWRGMQLPIELVIGESGSGKSTLCALRLAIITGEPKLRNSPHDLKDWHASISNSGGLHVTDNVQLIDRSLRQHLSDELCRITTEPNPFVEMRRYYTNNELMRVPVRAVFAFTSIQQPFQNADLIQRSIFLEFDKAATLDSKEGLVYDSEWDSHQLQRYGGREGWIAHHMYVLYKFFILVKQKWDPTYRAKHRLINFEQALLMMGEVFEEESSWIPDYLAKTIAHSLEESDWTFEGLKVYCDTMSSYFKPEQIIMAQHISEWATGHEDYKDCEMLTNPRKLGRYMTTHKTTIAQSVGLRENGKRANRVIYKYAPMDG